ncbi:hypothetical protein SORBI_3001G286400 [Sorghum bicolor]|uniref:Uncharacterized protein n=1 Tax=Sorghum bicolor TaxID=4558 RepID=A0A1Z5S822_SORBI|nr:hypothetical protein SORBI_3001G286400 [Sorghum bicolor]
MQRLSLGSPAGRSFRLSVAGDEEAEAADEKAAKAVARSPAPDKSIHLVPVLTLLCLLVLFLLSHDPSAALTDSPVLAAAATVTARSLEATAAGAGGGACPSPPRVSIADDAGKREFRGLALSTSHASSLAVWLFALQRTRRPRPAACTGG